MREDGNLGEAARSDRVSYWLDSSDGSERPRLTEPRTAQVVVVGAGIAGLTTGLLLAEGGVDVVVLEADRVAEGVSGYTTAKVTAGHRLLYSSLEHRHGRDAARIYAESQLAGLALLSELCSRHGIECELEDAANYVVARTANELDHLRSELEAGKRAGLSARWVTDLDEIPFAATGALALDGQLQFHPRRFLLAAAEVLERSGGKIHEGSRVSEIVGSGPFGVRVGEIEVRSDAVVVATHFPIVEQGYFVPRIHPWRSYVVAAPGTVGVPRGMFITTGDPSRSIRSAPLTADARLVLVGGQGHPVGRPSEGSNPYEILESFMREHFDVGMVTYRWSTQDNFSFDGLPFIGRMGQDPLYVATGFGGWGMSNGLLAAQMISGQIKDSKVSPWTATYDPGRQGLAGSTKEFIASNAAVGNHRLGGAQAEKSEPRTMRSILPGDGAIVPADGSDIAVSRAIDGTLLSVSGRCTHMGCRLAWNREDSSWDCPCHGSRFSPDGRILHGPALHPLEHKALPDDSSVAADSPGGR